MRVCILWHTFGPYHLARLHASEVLFADRGGQVIGVEIASRAGLHRWDRRPAQDDGRLTLFPGLSIESLTRRQIYRRVTAALDELNPAAVALSAYSNPDAHAGLLWARANNRVAVVMSESTREDAPRTGLKERAKRAIVSEFDSALAGGSPQSRYIAELGVPTGRIFTPYDCVDNDYFASQAAVARSYDRGAHELPGLQTPEIPYFLASGRFMERKNYEALIRAYAHYRRRCTTGVAPWNLIILGDGPTKPRVADLIARLVPSGAVTLAGYRQVSEAAVYYALAGAFVHPATVEQWGLVLNEAMAAGLPLVVSMNVGAAEDLVIDGENGFLFDPHNEASIADALARMADPSLPRSEMGDRSAELIKGWAPDRFAIGLWDAVASGIVRSPQVGWLARTLIGANLLAPKSLLTWRSAEA